MKRILSILLAVVVTVNCTVFALATNSVSGEIYYYYCGTNQYANAAKITVSDYRADASTRIETSPHTVVTPGFIGASSELYDSNKNMLASSPRVTNSSKSYYCNSLNATADNSSNRKYYATGHTYVWTENGYQEDSTYPTSSISSGERDYAVNDAGQSYGSAFLARTREERPDLIAAVGNNGTIGYVYASDLDAGEPTTPDEAVAQQKLLDELIAENNNSERIVLRTIPLYDVDGVTVLDEYDIAFTPSDNNWRDISTDVSSEEAGPNVNSENHELTSEILSEPTLPSAIPSELDAEPAIVMGSDGNNYVMTGPHNSILLVKSISDEEYSEMMDILYPNGILDGQGQEIGGISNMEDVRAQFIASHMSAFAVDGNSQSEVELIPFTLTLESQANGEFTALFYSAHIGQDAFVFPSEWGVQPFGFTHKSENGVFLAFTDMGIWKIDPQRLLSTKITTDLYLGRTQAEISEDLRALDPEAYLVWIDNVHISPNGKYVVYRTNRDIGKLDDTSIWRIDLDNYSEEQLVSPELNNDIVGFIYDDAVVIGSLENTRMVNIQSQNSTAIEIPELPNACVKAVKDGTIVFSSYENGSSRSTAYINEVDLNTGEMSEITSVSGYLDGEPDFSPSGKKLAIGCGEDALTGIDDVVIVNTNTGNQMMLSDTAQVTRRSREASNIITNCLWLGEETLLLNTQEENDIPEVETLPTPRTAAYDVVFANTPPSIVNFWSPLSNNSYSGFARVNSKWNQPRGVGTNPHNGVDLQASLGTNVYAPYAGWSTAISNTGPSDIQFLVDANKNGVQDDGDYYIRFYHMSAREPVGYKSQGALIGKSGNAGGYPAHLHFGLCSTSGNLKWYRNEVNYRHLSSSSWASGQDLDIYSQVRWNDNRPSIIAYVRDETGKTALSEVYMFYRTTPTGKWTEGGVMTKSGDTYTYDFNGKFPKGTTIYWMVRLTRSGVPQPAFCPAKFYQPDKNPNGPSAAYGYWTNKMV